MNRFFIFLLAVLISQASVQAQAKLFFDFKTGDDDLRKARDQKDPELRIFVNGKADMVKETINRGTTWPNNSTRRITIDLPPDIGITELSGFQIYRQPLHKGGIIWEYLDKDNWTLKGLTVTLLLTTPADEITVKDGPVPASTRQFVIFRSETRGNVFRFKYDGGDNVREGNTFRGIFDFSGSAETPAPATDNVTMTALFGTGSDNLEGGNDNNINILFYFKSSPGIVTLENANKKTKWNNYSQHTIRQVIPGSASMNIDDISHVVIRHTGGGGSFADNWNMNKLRLSVEKGAEKKVLIDAVGTPVHRFTGEERSKQFDITGATSQESLKLATIRAVFGTGGDNLEGGTTNNVSMYIYVSNRSTPILLYKLNGGQKWDNNTERTVVREVPGSGDLDFSKISKIELVHSGGGGVGADNWNLDKFKLTISRPGESRILVDQIKVPIHRFTGDSRKKSFNME